MELSNLVVVGTDKDDPNASVPVAKVIDFTDLSVAFNDTLPNKFEPFPVTTAFGHKDSRFEFGSNGTNGNLDVGDPLYQYGLKLTLVHEFNDIKVKVCLSVAFRGATNDFDPGNVPVHLNLYPQIGYTWERTTTGTRFVRQFRGSVRITVNNETPATTRVPAEGDMGEIMAMPAVHENIANCFADSNVSKETGNTRCAIMIHGKTADLWNPPLILGGPSHRDKELINDPKPFGWGIVFDYLLMNAKQEVEYPAVYGPNDGAFYADPLRTRLYKWPASGAGFVPDYKVGKVSRQGFYDNIHLHGRMGMPDINGNEQIHAPFCGHSCVHLHWRWSGTAGGTAPEGRRWQYKGWSAKGKIEAYQTDGSPLVPPNQKVTVALCRPKHTRADDTHIVAGSAALDPLEKLIWYCADVIHTKDLPINQSEQQVIMEMGLGWAYRYALKSDNDSAIYGIFSLLTLFNGAPKEYTQPRIMEFFEKKVYPGFRYFDDGTIKCDQIPPGTHAEEMTGPGKSMESL